MGDLFGNYDVWGAIWTTIRLALLGIVGSFVLGVVFAVFRVSPVAALRGIGTAYVTIFRNTPLALLMVFSILGVSMVLNMSVSDNAATNSFWWATIALSVYHGAFMCEAVRSGINTVPVGQAEAARSIGLGFMQSLRLVILPQATRGAIAPVGSTIIALIKNTTVVEVIGVADCSKLLATVTENEGASIPVFLFFSLVFVVLTLPIGLGTTALSRKMSVKR